MALFLHKLNRCIITAAKLSIIDFLTCLLQKVINKRSSWSSTFSSLFLKILWKICIKSNNWHYFYTNLKGKLPRQQMGYHRLSNSSSLKSYQQKFFMKFDFFFTLFENSLKNFYKIQQLALFLHKFKRLIITATKWAIIDFLTRLLQKHINKRFSWSSTFFTLFENYLINLY